MVRINYVTIGLTAIALLALGVLTLRGRPTEAFLTGAIALITLAQSGKALRLGDSRRTDDVDVPPPSVVDLSEPTSRDSETKPSIPIKIKEGQ